MVNVRLEDDAVVVELSPVEKFLALHGSLRIPYEHITGVRVEDENGWKRMWGKLAGTNFPPYKIAGTFFGDGGLVFCDYRDGQNCLVIETRDETYRTVYIQPTGQDVSALADRLSKHVAA